MTYVRKYTIEALSLHILKVCAFIMILAILAILAILVILAILIIPMVLIYIHAFFWFNKLNF